jgi:hypothetical protein
MTWRERIQAARARGRFTLEDEFDAVYSWETCAVGEQASQYGYDVIKFRASMPSDAELRRLGGRAGFARAVESQRFDDAEHFLGLIEDRALQLKREQHA